MNESLQQVRVEGEAFPRDVIGSGNFGYPVYTTAALPERLWTGLPPARRVATVRHGDREAILRPLPTPAENYTARQGEFVPFDETRATLQRIESLWLLTEDDHHLLDAEEIEPLAHQASLVKHVLDSPDLKRVLIADEVGLGKTIEAGLIIKRLREQQDLAVLYLTESRLVRNVADEFRLLGLRPRMWSSSSKEARIESDDSDPLVIASMHLSVANDNRFEAIAASGPWDLIVVDEAHHLSDYTEDGSDPRRRMRLVRQLLEERLRGDGRLLLLTATPHQGHLDRYKNLLRLLSPSRDEREAQGKVVYRLKEDIRDWEGRPLFPTREVHPPTPVEVGPGYRDWLEAVRDLFTRGDETRAAGWRRAQALQWCASSPMAGVAYLARYALRLGLDPAVEPALREAILQLRPYRGGPVDESWDSLFGRISAAVKQTEDDEGDEDAGEVAPGDTDHQRELIQCIAEGADLLRVDAFRAKLDALIQQLARAPKLVVFAQPVETVWAIKTRLEEELGDGSVSIIVGGQSEDERGSEIGRFWETSDGSRVLVSSRSGGEGINLQVCNQLVHFDVPWNPMEMEQRVGRVHRYGSVDRIQVHTLILEGSREERVLERAKAKLASIARSVGWDEERREQFFGRTMSLVPLEELTALMAAENLGPLSDAEERQLQDMVQTGFEQWRAADGEFRELSTRLMGVDRGPLTDADLERGLQTILGAERRDGWSYRKLVERDGDTATEDSPAHVFETPDGTLGVVGTPQGVALLDPEGASRRPTRLGLNTPEVASALRRKCELDPRSADGPTLRGVGCVEVSRESWDEALGALGVEGRSCVVLVAVSTLVEISSGAEVGRRVLVSISSAAGVRELDRNMGAAVIRALLVGRAARRDLSSDAGDLASIERSMRESLRAAGDPEKGIVAAVFPLGAIQVYRT